MAEQTETGRRLRVKERKHYTDEGIDDDEIEGKRNFDVLEKVRSDKYDATFVQTLTGHEFNLKYIQETGLQKPIMIHDKTGLGMRIPSQSFQVRDVKQCVGSRRMLDVMDVNTQKGLEMSMKDWVKYYETTDRERLLNVISLEFSHTRLETYVESPTVVRQIDWVDTAWPRHLKEIHTEATNIIEKMKYPKVQKYCLMSVGGCYTDFHIDFGGTSVWYHILHGEKVFWLIPPTEENMQQYENWVLSGKQGDLFLADQVAQCQRVQLYAGDTFMIPSGWIHAVYTPKDSLVFGGNFVHSFNILQQLRVAEMEDKTRVPQKFRYPFYTEVMWYVLAQYLKCLTGKSFLKKPKKENEKSENSSETPTKSENGDEDIDDKGSESSLNLSKSVKVELTRIDGSDIVLSNGIDPSPKLKQSSRKGGDTANGESSVENSPEKIDETSACGDSGSLVKMKRENSDLSERDSEVDFPNKTGADKIMSETGMPASEKYVHVTPYELEGLEKLVDYLENLSPSKRGVPKDFTDPDAVISGIKTLLEEHRDDDPVLAASGEEIIKWPPSTKIPKMKTKASSGSGGKANKLGKKGAGNRRRRTRCKKCPACNRGDCAECHFCKDMKKFGGPGRMKQSCISRQCMAPVLPNTAICIICNTDERTEAEDEDSPSTTSLMECGICWEIVHPGCLTTKYENLDNDGVVNEDLPNSWECPKCCFDGKQGQLKPRIIKGKEKLAAAEVGDRMEQDDTSPKTKPAKLVGGKRVTSKIGTVPKLKSTSLIGRKGKLKKAILIAKGVNRKTIVPNKVNAALKTVKKNFTKTLEKVKSPPVVTRSGRTVVQKRAPDHEDEPDVTPSKRPRREESVASLGRGRGRGKKGRGALSTPSGRGQGLRIRTETSTPRSSRGRGRGRGRGSKGTNNRALDGHSSSPTEASNSTPPEGLVSEGGSGASTPVSVQKVIGGDAGPTKGKGKTKAPNDSKEDPPAKKLKIIPEKHVVRPAPIPPPSDTLETSTGEPHVMTRPVWLKVFEFLPHSDLARCMVVCKTWNRWCINRLLWHELDLSHKKLKQVHLIGIVRRQPAVLNLNYAVISPKQLSWLIERLPHLKNLSLAYCSWATLSALCTSSCPLLTYLDLSWASGLKDMCFKDLISPPMDHRPAVRIISRLHRVVELQMAGTDISDSSLAIMPRHLTNLEKLDLSYCIKLTNKGIEYLTNEGTSTRYNLKELDLTGCNQLTGECFTFLANCPKLVRVKLKACHKIAIEDCQAFTVTYAHRKLSMRNDFDKLIVFARDLEDLC